MIKAKERGVEIEPERGRSWPGARQRFFMWIWKQQAGELTRNGEHVAFGYSGAGAARNDPDKQRIHSVGPIPRGNYNIGSVILFTAVHGAKVLPLIPDPGNQMFGRSGFLIHGDSKVSPGSASEGCIILDRHIRELMAASGDFRLQVVA